MTIRTNTDTIGSSTKSNLAVIGGPQRTPPSVEIIEAIADQEGEDPTDLTFCLHDSIDPDALDALFSGSNAGSGLRVEFTVAGYTVVVEDDDITVVA